MKLHILRRMDEQYQISSRSAYFYLDWNKMCLIITIADDAVVSILLTILIIFYAYVDKEIKKI